jgi:hypothetical protein
MQESGSTQLTRTLQLSLMMHTYVSIYMPFMLKAAGPTAAPGWRWLRTRPHQVEHKRQDQNGIPLHRHNYPWNLAYATIETNTAVYRSQTGTVAVGP